MVAGDPVSISAGVLTPLTAIGPNTMWPSFNFAVVDG